MQRRRWQLFIVFAVVCVLMGVVTRGYLLDDALITLRYARHLAASGRATWNPPGSESPHLGYTSLGWMTVEALMALVVHDADALIVCTKLAAGASLILVSWLFADRLARCNAPMSKCLVFGLLLFVNAGHGLHANSGMETLPFCAVTLLVIWSRDRRQAPLASYAWGALAMLVRPEGILMTPVLAWFDWRAGRKKILAVGCGLIALTIAAVLLILILGYDSPIPSAVSLKLGTAHPKHFAVLGVAFFLVLCVPAFLCACILIARGGDGTSKLALAMAATLLAFLCFVRPIMNHCFRYEWPALFWLAFGAIPIIERDAIPARWLRRAMLVAMGAVNLRTSAIALNCVWLEHDSDYDRDIGLALGRSMRPGEWLAIIDAGTVPYYADVPTHDAVGLADGTAARLAGPYPYSVFCRPDVAVVVVGVNDDDDELLSALAQCGFVQRVYVPVLSCGAHWFAKVAFARESVRLDRAALASRSYFEEWCISVLPNYMGLRSWKTWLRWDGRSW